MEFFIHFINSINQSINLLMIEKSVHYTGRSIEVFFIDSWLFFFIIQKLS